VLTQTRSERQAMICGEDALVSIDQPVVSTTTGCSGDARQYILQNHHHSVTNFESDKWVSLKLAEKTWILKWSALVDDFRTFQSSEVPLGSF
jgi:hypothetical protein